jgi:hypothetical protein
VNCGSSRPPEAAGFVEKQDSQAACLLLVRSKRPTPRLGDARLRDERRGEERVHRVTVAMHELHG